jgi:histone acetyltransferase 1
LSQFIILPPFQGLGIGSTMLKIIYDHYINDKTCSEFSVEEPSDEFQSLMDLIEVKLIWQNGFFTSLRKLFKNKKGNSNTLINIGNFDEVHLDNEEINKIIKKLKLTKQRIIRCFELIILARLDPKDALVHQRFGSEIKKKL